MEAFDWHDELAKCLELVAIVEEDLAAHLHLPYLHIDVATAAAAAAAIRDAMRSVVAQDAAKQFAVVVERRAGRVERRHGHARRGALLQLSAVSCCCCCGLFATNRQHEYGLMQLVVDEIGRARVDVVLLVCQAGRHRRRRL